MNRDEMYLSLGVSDKVLQFGEAVLDAVSYTHLTLPTKSS